MDIFEQYEKEHQELFREKSPEHFYDPDTPQMIQWVMKHSGGLVKDGKQANYVLVGFVIVAIIISLFLLFGGSLGVSIDKTAIDQMMKLHPEIKQ